MRTSTFLSILALLLLSGCLQAQDSPPSGGPSVPECPLTAEPQQGTIYTETGEYNVSAGGMAPSASGSYDEFEWDWPSGNPISMSILAEWNAGTLDEKSMQMRVVLRSEYLDSLAMAYGPSPLLLNFTMNVPDRGDLAVVMEPRGTAVNKEAFETHVTMVQTLLCE